ncbi:MAG: phosphopyruvate hydratase [Patescibacteria group bacterium]|nr:phosphopyruvate hydratase [Patescibacteria group bacterium]MBU1877074.1 phosphopyruvate hydratase [Patescibacteria group bacterium]
MIIKKIKNIKAREILDSRGIPTIEVDLAVDNDFFRAAVPSGSSTGRYEAFELRDKDKNRYRGNGVRQAVQNVNKILAPKLKGMKVIEQEKIDNLMVEIDGTENKSKLGANAILGVSMAICRAGALTQKMPLWKWISKLTGTKPSLPQPCFNIINGGKHAGNDLDFQEFMIVPGLGNFSKNLQAGVEIYHTLEEILKKEYGKSAVNLGYEGGFSPSLKFPIQALNLILLAVKRAGYNKKVKIAIDVAASEIKSKKYDIDFYSDLVKQYPIIFLEDPFSEDDWNDFSNITKRLGRKTIIVGDDLLVTNPKNIIKAQEEKACNGLLLKVNQIGTLTEAFQAFNLVKAFNWKVVVSHRSGETDDNFISDLAVGLGADFIKAGAPARGERVAKYNQLLRIEENF